MSSIFLSHSSRDNAEAKELMQWLREQGFENTFLDIDEITGLQPSHDWESDLYEKISICNAVILLLTPNWYASKWCFAEFVQARAAGKAIFPIIFAPCGERFVARDIQQLDLLRDREGGLHRLRSELTRIMLDAQGGFEWDRRRSPYPGLAAFEREDAAIYFGRDSEIRSLIECLQARRVQGAPRLVVVLGASGTGKSSLVRSGVLPRLERYDRHWLVMPPFRPQLDPLTEMAKCLALQQDELAEWRKVLAWLEEGDVSALNMFLTDMLMRAGRPDGRVLITIDQMEELFTVTPPPARDVFLERITALTSVTRSVLILLTLRSDFLGQLQPVMSRIGRFQEFSLGPMPQTRVPEVIEGPARVAGVRIGLGLVAAIMHDASSPEALPLIAFALRELYTNAERDVSGAVRTLTLVDYHRLGDQGKGLSHLDNIVRRRADEVLNALSLDVHEAAALRTTFVTALVRIDDSGRYSRRPASEDELHPQSRRATEAFVEARLLTARSESAVRMIEVAHEALLHKWPQLVAWLDEEREFLLGRLQLERARVDWVNAAPPERDQALLQGLMLQRAAEWLRERPESLTPPQRDFILSSSDSAKRRALQQKRARRLGYTLVIALLTSIIGLGVYLTLERRAAVALQIEVDADRFIRLAGAALESGQAERALGHAAQAYAVLPDAKSRSVLWQAGVAISPFLERVYNVKSSVAPVALGWWTDSERLIVGDSDGDLHLIDPAGRLDLVSAERRRARDKNIPETVRALSAQGGITALRADGSVLRWSADEKRLRLIAELPNISTAAITEDGAHIAAVTESDHRVLWLDCARTLNDSGRCKVVPTLHVDVQRPSAIALNRAATDLALGTESGRVLLARPTTSHRPREIALSNVETDRVLTIVWKPDSSALLVGTRSGTLHLVNRDASAVSRIDTRAPHGINTVAWSHDGQRFAANCESFAVCVWSLGASPRPELEMTLVGHRSTVTALLWSPGGKQIVSIDLDRTVRVWGVGSAQNGPTAVLRSPDGAALTDIDSDSAGRLLAAGDVNGHTLIWDSLQQRLVSRLPSPQPPAEIRATRFSPSGTYLAVSSLHAGVSLHDVTRIVKREHPSIAATLRLDTVVETVRWLPRSPGPQLIIGGQDGTVRVWHVERDRGTVVLRNKHEEAIQAVTAVPANRSGESDLIYSVDTLGIVKSHETDAELSSKYYVTTKELVGRNISMDSLAFSTGGREMLLAGNSGDVLLIDVARRELVARLETGADMVTSASISNDGNMIAAVDNAARLHVWRLADRKLLGSVLLRVEVGRSSTDEFGRTQQLRRLAWLPDNRRIAIAAQSGVVMLLTVNDAPWLELAQAIARAP
jgi:WD40 repeat protein